MNHQETAKKTGIGDNKNFQTPDWCCELMSSLVPEGTKEVLEPTPGAGNLVKSLSKRFLVTSPNGDFFNFDISSSPKCVVMNPPFTPMVTGYRILYRCMEQAHVIITLLPWLAVINSEKRTRDIIEFGLERLIHLPRSTFKGSRVQCCILVMKRGHTGFTTFEAAKR
jgi:hypothetical protein